MRANFQTFENSSVGTSTTGPLPVTAYVDFVDSDNYYGPFPEGMRELGYVEGKNLVIEWRSAEGQVQTVS